MSIFLAVSHIVATYINMRRNIFDEISDIFAEQWNEISYAMKEQIRQDIELLMKGGKTSTGSTLIDFVKLGLFVETKISLRNTLTTLLKSYYTATAINILW